MKRQFPWKIAGAVAVVIVVLLAVSLLPVREWADSIEDRIENMDLGAGLLLFAGVYFIATLLLVPAWVFPIAAGAAFGFMWGIAVTMATALASSIAAFFMARHLLRDRALRLCRRYPRFGAIEKTVQTAGWKMVALMRVSPLLPFGVKNYLFGTTRVPMRDYVLGTFVGLLPGMLMKVYIGWAGRAAFGSKAGILEYALLAAGIIATLSLSYLVSLRMKARFKIA